MIVTSPYQVAMRLLGTRERPGPKDDPFILWCLQVAGHPDVREETPWCGAFVAGLATLLGLPIPPAPAAARSWLRVGVEVPRPEARPDSDVVVLSRGSHPQAGHVGLFVGFSLDGTQVGLLGGNQGDAVSVQYFPASRILGIRRLA